jgi:DNA-binding CsgD family transcriptional regulator
MTIHFDHRSFVLAAIVAVAGVVLSWPLWQATVGAAAIVGFGVITATLLTPRRAPEPAAQLAPPAAPSVLPPYPPRPGAIYPLTPTQTKVAALVAQGLSTKEMAAAMFVEPSTIENHIQAIFDKLDFHRRPQIAVWAVAHGLYNPEVSTQK